MKKDKIKDLLFIECTQEEINDAISILPDEFAGKPLKANINKYFKKDGTAKVKKQTGQEWHDIQGFIRRQVGKQIHISRLKNRRDAKKKLIKEKKTRTHRVDELGKIERIKPDKIRAEPEIIIDPAVIRNKLVLKYNQMVREGNPATKELRRQIHEQIGKIESSSG